MARAAEIAARDLGGAGLLAEVDLVGTVEPIAWYYDELPEQLGKRVSASPDQTVRPVMGGNAPCLLLNEVANRVAEGGARLALLAGAETLYSRNRARKEGVELDWSSRPAGWQDVLGDQRPLCNPLEQRHGLFAPIHGFPLIENALRAKAGRSIEEHQVAVSHLMACLTEVAARNPYAWFPDALTSEEIRTVSAENRWICFPYPKRMNAIITVDQAAALLVMSESEADRRGIPPERRAYCLGGADATDAWCVTERADVATSPAYRRASRHAMGESGVRLEDVDAFDLYSCFPSAVEIALEELGLALDEPRPLTVTGGLAYAGGPGNNYSLHALANMTESVLRGETRVGYVSALGMISTKHSVSILGDASRAQAASGCSHGVELPEEERTGPPLVDAPEGAGRIETYTVLFARDNRPERSVVVVRLDDGRRTVAHGEETPAAFARLLEQEGIGAKGRVIPGEGNAPNRFVLAE
jgi:acetyl-CoA C-acetyltransferase